MDALAGFTQEDFDNNPQQDTSPLAGWTQDDFARPVEFDTTLEKERTLGQRAGDFFQAAKQGTIRGWRSAAGTADLMTTGMALNIAKGLGLENAQENLEKEALQVMESNEAAKKEIEAGIPKGYETVSDVSEFFTDPTAIASMVVGGPATKGLVKQGGRLVRLGTGGALSGTGKVITKVAQPIAQRIEPLANASLAGFIIPGGEKVAAVVNTPRVLAGTGKTLSKFGEFVAGTAPKQMDLFARRGASKIPDILAQGTATGLNLGGNKLIINKAVPENGTAAIYESQ